MKKLFFIPALLILITLVAQAHPAKKVNLTYSNGKLKIEAIHKVSNESKHYIDKIVVNVDGKDVKTIENKSQTSLNSELIEVTIPEIKNGSEVVVTAFCNVMGKKTGKLTVK